MFFIELNGLLWILFGKLDYCQVTANLFLLCIIEHQSQGRFFLLLLFILIFLYVTLIKGSLIFALFCLVLFLFRYSQEQHYRHLRGGEL